MTYQVPPIDPHAPAIVIDIGNTSISIAAWQASELKAPLAVAKDDLDGFKEAFEESVKSASQRSTPVVAIASVVPSALAWVRSSVTETIDRNALVIGDTIPLPIDVGVDDPAAIGVDRVCAAAAAYDKMETGCIVVDFGTAVTVDLIDDTGTLVGGAILPGPDLQLQSLHEQTAVLPQVKPAVPELPFGRNTVEAMQVGVCCGVVGAVRGLVEAYAAWLKHWPQVVATGGDLEMLMPYCDYIDTAVPNLVLRGIGVALSKHLEELGV